MSSQIDRSEPNTGSFNDLPLYLSLRRQPGCVRVDLVRVIVRRNSYILGIQSVYRCTWKDGTTSETEGRYHDFETGPFASQGAGGTPTVQIFALESDEYLGDVFHGKVRFLTRSCLSRIVAQSLLEGLGGTSDLVV